MVPCTRILGRIDLSFYLVADFPAFQKNTALFFEKIREAVKGGVTCVQLRDLKNDSTVSREVAFHLKGLLPVPLIINTKDIIEVAKRVHAEGVFLEDPFSASEAREQLGERANIGLPLRSMDEFWMLPSTSINYISLKVFKSKQTSKEGACWGVEGLQRVRNLAQMPIVAIGGIDAMNANQISRILHPGDGIAMSGSLLRENDPLSLAQKVSMIFQEAQREKRKKCLCDNL